LDAARKIALVLAEAPHVSYVIDHYADCPMVLLRLSRISVESLRGPPASAQRFIFEQGRRKPAG
jgi:hypothetical protein